MPAIRNNKLRIVFYALEVYSLIGGEFHVKDHAITSGQPSDIKNGDALKLDKNGYLNFRVGRKKSGHVAKWFNEQCDTSKCTTFGHAAGELNFAFIGTLRLRVSYKSVKQLTLTFDDIIIAQGRSGTANNWWFGGKSCLKIHASEKVESTGVTSENNDHYRFTFYRGKNIVNALVIDRISFLTWMNNIEDSKYLNEINIPGTHDSGTYNFKTVIVENYVRTQSLSIRGQLDLGIRYFDIRCRHVQNTCQIYHGKFDVHLNFDDVLKQCIDFINENESESIILLVSETNRPVGINRPFYETFLDYVNKTSDYWYRGSSTIPNIKDVRKKLFLMYRFDFAIGSFGIDCSDWKNNARFDINHDNFTMAIQDEYEVSYRDKRRSIMEMVDSSKERKNRYWYLNYISLAASLERGTIVDTARYTNWIINEIVTMQRNAFLGLLIMDYPENNRLLTSDIIDNNDFFR